MRRTFLNSTFGLICLVSASFFGTDAVLAQSSSSSSAGETEFWAQVERLGRNLDSLWGRELNAAVNLILHKRDMLRGIKFEGVAQDLDVNQRCEIIPKADIKTKTVRFDRRELIGLSFANSYSLLAYLVGSELLSTPADVDRFVRKRASPFLRQLINACIDTDSPRVTYRWNDLREISIYRGINPRIKQRNVQHVARRSGQNFDDRNLHNFVAVFPIAFVLLHEAAHILVKEEGLNLMEVEQRADKFAVDTFHGSRVPATLGIPFLQMFGARSSESEMNCRISKIAAGDRSKLGASVEMRASEITRLEMLRSYYENTYRNDCQ